MLANQADHQGRIHGYGVLMHGGLFDQLVSKHWDAGELLAHQISPGSADEETERRIGLYNSTLMVFNPDEGHGRGFGNGIE
jgi:hypothetical protein